VKLLNRSRPFWIFKILIFCQVTILGTKICMCKPNSSKSDIHARDIMIKLFSKWRPSTILSFGNLLFWLCDVSLCVILLCNTPFGINQTIIQRDTAKKLVQDGIKNQNINLNQALFHPLFYPRYISVFVFHYG